MYTTVNTQKSLWYRILVTSKYFFSSSLVKLIAAMDTFLVTV